MGVRSADTLHSRKSIYNLTQPSACRFPIMDGKYVVPLYENIVYGKVVIQFSRMNYLINNSSKTGYPFERKQNQRSQPYMKNSRPIKNVIKHKIKSLRKSKRLLGTQKYKIYTHTVYKTSGRAKEQSQQSKDARAQNHQQSGNHKLKY